MTVRQPPQPKPKKAELEANPRNPMYLALDEIDISYIKALIKGAATPEQQRAVFNCIVTKICKIGAISFNSDPLVMAFNEGQRMVGSHLLHIAAQPYDKLKES